MARTTPRVEEATLIAASSPADAIGVGTPAWYAWLEQATSFAFVGVQGRFTARKERRGQTGWYWKAYRKHKGTLHRAYLGKSTDLTYERLTAIASELAQRAAGLPPAASPNLVASPAVRKDGELAQLPTDFPPLRALNAQPAWTSPDVASLLASKLHIPAPRPRFVPRPHLMDRIHAGLRGKLTLIAAPAGFGKTTLLSEWRATTAGSHTPVAWVSLDADDNDSGRFWAYVIAALEMVYPAMGISALALLRSRQPPPMNAIVTSLINAITPIPIDAVLVLDDYHLITTPTIHAAVSFLLDHLPPQLHLVMLTRADPPLPLTRLRTRGELTELRAADLRFTAGEAAAFLTDVMGLLLTSDQVAALELRTEGWVAGLQLTALALQNHPDPTGFVAAFSGSHRFVVDYLVEEVLARLPAHLQTFVLRTAILDRLCGPLCDAILGLEARELSLGDIAASSLKPGRPLGPSSLGAYSQLVLEELERVNLFLIPLDDERRWYRYHQLFAEVLRERLRSGATASEVATLYQRASAWHEQAGLIGEAVRYAFLARDVERAAALIERHAMILLLASSDLLLVRAWVEQLPRALILARPRLVLIAGATLAVAGQFDAFEKLLADAAPALNAPDLPSNIVGELLALRSSVARFQGDGPSTLALARQALAQLALDNYAIRALVALNIGVASMWSGELAAAKTALAEAAALGELDGQWIALGALEELGSLQGRQGQLRQVRQTSEQAIQLSARSGGRLIPAAGAGHVLIAEVLYEWNDLTGAIHAASQGIDLLRGTVERLLLVRGYIALALVYQANGDGDGALEYISRCAAWFAQTPIAATGVARAWLDAHQARLWVQQGNVTAAAQWAQACAFAGDSELGHVQQLTLVRLRLAQSQNDPSGQLLGEASTIVRRILPTIETRGWIRYLIETLVLQAIVCQKQRDRAGARTALERALILAEPEGFIRFFVDAGPPLAELLTQLARGDSPAAAYAGRLLGVFAERLEPGDVRLADAISASSRGALWASQASTLVEPLTERELEILHLIAGGHSNQAIADTLIIAVATVKRHINNIYGKLAVQSRTQALARARELQLL
jgi:LuxR family transcriptional regulator, maltose regulon positive regulatory protein